MPTGKTLSLAFVYEHETPLVRARTSALAGKADTHVIALVAKSAHYKWTNSAEQTGYTSQTLFDTAPGEHAEERAVIKALEARDPDVVFVTGYSRRFARAALHYALAANKPRVLISVSTRHEASGSKVVETVKKTLVGAHHAAFVGGTAQAEQLIALGMPEERIFYGYDAVDNDLIAARADEARQLPNGPGAELGLDTPYFVTIARLVWQKNLDRLVEAFALYRKNNPSSTHKLVIAGYGPLEDAVHAQIAARGLENEILMPGAVPYEKIPALLAGADAFVLPSVSEPWGLVVNEAMAAGLPVAISNICGCAPDLVEEGRNGYTYDPESIEAIAGAMSNLTADPERLKAMGTASREIIARWGPARFASGALAAAQCAMATKVGAAPSLTARALVTAMRVQKDRVRGFG